MSEEMIDIARNATAIASWSDEKKKDYVALFRKRAAAATYISRRTANALAVRAREKHFLGEVQFRSLCAKTNDFAGNEGPYYHADAHVWLNTYDRTQQDMEVIVTDRVKALLDELPTLKAAMHILDAATAEKIIQRDALEEECNALKDEYQALSEPISMAAQDQEMTIGAFRAMVKEREDERRQILEAIDEKAAVGQQLDKEIFRVLYKGIPGIADEISEVVLDLYKQSQELGTTMRNVENVVLYGDNESALKILETFNKDEHRISTDIGKRFQSSLERLKLHVNGKKIKTPKSLK